MAKKLFGLTINRNRWFRGRGSDGSQLLTDEGQMCCLGFLARACGIPANEILDRATPEELFDHDAYPLVEGDPRWYKKVEQSPFIELVGDLHTPDNSDICEKLMEVNDSLSDECPDYSDGISERVREKTIKQLMRKIGIKVTYTGTKPAWPKQHGE